MPRVKHPLHDEGLGELAERFDRWRAAQSSDKQRLPASLWNEAVALSCRLPLSRVAKALRLGVGELRRRRDGAMAADGAAAATPSSTATFVEVEALVGGIDVEIHRRDGARLCLRYPGDAPVTALVQAFLAG